MVPGSRRLWLVVLLAVSSFAFGFDLGRAPERQWTARGLLGAIDAYQATISPRLGNLGVRCRFEPTCSHYGEESIRRHGALLGVSRAVRRVARCGPWTEPGTVDPPLE